MTPDSKLRQHFQDLRAADAQQVPVFSRVARVPVRPFALPWLRLAAGAVVVVTLLMVLTIKHRPVADTQQWAALSNWRATTDELLTVATTPWDSTVSTPTDSWIQNSTQTNHKETL